MDGLETSSRSEKFSNRVLRTLLALGPRKHYYPGFYELLYLSQNILKSLCNKSIDSGAVLNLALNELEESFSAVVECLQFNFKEIGDVCTPSTASVQHHHQKPAVEVLNDDVDDLTWFFEESDKDFLVQSLIIPSSTFKETTSALIDDQPSRWYSDSWLCSGLSNYRLRDDFDTLYPQDGCATLPLHMSLARSVAEVLWLSTEATSANHSFLLQRKQNEMANSCECVEEKLNHLNILTISGKAVDQSLITPRAVAFSTYSDLWFAISSEGQRPCIGEGESIVQAVDFYRTIIWMTEDDVTLASPLGSSLQARHTSTVVTLSVEEFIRQSCNSSSSSMQQFSSESDRLAESLRYHKIDLLLCSPSAYSDQLTIACKIRHIAVLCMGPQELSAASLLCQATPVEDISYLEEDWVGKRPVRVRLLMDVPHCKGNSKSSRIERRSAFHPIEAEEEEEESIESDANSSIGLGDEVVLSLELRDDHYIPCDECLPVSVVICGMTAITIRSLFNSFLRSLNQIGSVILSPDSSRERHFPSRSGVMPGGGIPELLTAIVLQQIAHRMESTGVQANCVVATSREEQRNDQHAEVSSLLRNFAGALIDYPRKIMLDHGLTYPQTEVQLERSITQLRYICSMINTRNCLTFPPQSISFLVHDDVLSALRTMSDEDKRDLAAVVHTQMHGVTTITPDLMTAGITNEISGMEINSLDVAVIKVDALRTAVSIIRHLYRPFYKIV
eukprot:gene23533-31886_t